MTTRITQQQLESYLWGAATLLRGTIDAGDYKQFIFPLLFYKRLCDVFDEETRTALAESGGDEEFAAYPENHRFQIPPEAHWEEVRKTARDVGRALQNALRAIETANPDRLYGIFGDAQWTNKERLSDAMLRDLIEHFSRLKLTIANLPEDELGQGYEYLIKKFADDSGHTAAEFYTNRTVVHLMTEMLRPQPGESIYDPTCGSGGMLLSAIAHLRRQDKEWRNVKLYGQERNLMTSSIARMNCFLHGIENFRIERGDTLAEPRLVQGDRLMRFDVVLANPPYSIKQWDRSAFASDPWGRNHYGTPPQGRADYAFWQHILTSLAPQTGRCAILFPHGVLFRQEEAEMRRRLIEADVVECVLGLGPNLFYNSPMEACVVICRTAKPKERRNKVLLINAVNEVTRERAQSFLTEDHIERIVKAYGRFADEPGFARVASLEEILARDGNLNIPLYVAPASSAVGEEGATYRTNDLPLALDAWLASRKTVVESLRAILSDISSPALDKTLNGLDTGAIFDRSKWQRVRFGDVVRMLKEQVDPGSGEVDRYIAGEHMETENVHIRKWGTVGDGYLGPAFIRRFRKGQVLYGSRRTYLKKVAMAEFDGVTANTTFVLQAHGGKLLQDLLPWLMLSERFTQHSIRESKGSTNPYINFPDIAKFEFDLPPLDQQRRIAEILWAVDKSIRWLEKTRRDTQLLLNSTKEFHFALVKHRFKKLNSAVESSAYGPRFSNSLYSSTGTIAQMRTTDISDEGEISYNTIPRVDLKAEDLVDHILEDGDFLISRSGTCGIGAVYRNKGGIPTVPGAFLIRLRLTDKLSADYLCEYVNSPVGRRHMDRLMAGGVQKNIRGSALLAEEVPMPPHQVQEEFLIQCTKHRVCVTSLNESICSARRLLISVVNILTSKYYPEPYHASHQQRTGHHPA